MGRGNVEKWRRRTEIIRDGKLIKRGGKMSDRDLRTGVRKI